MNDSSLKNVLRAYLPEHQRTMETDGLPLTDIISGIKKNYSSENGKRLTNLFADKKIQTGNLKLSFIYKREALQVECSVKDLFFFGIKAKPPGDYRTYLLNSGQACIHTLINYFTLILKSKAMDVAGHVYIGTKKLALIHNLKMEQVKLTKKPNRVLWICSAYFKMEDHKQVKKGFYDHVVIDTTCWAQDSITLQKLLRYHSTSCIYLLRSSTKLDMGGVEYGSLGTLVALIPPKNKKNVLIELDRIINLSGATAGLDDIPPYLFDKKFFNLNLKRIYGLEKVTSQIEQKNKWILPPEVRSHFPEHLKYFFILFKNYDKTKTSEFQKLFDKILHLNGVDHKVIPSFGFNELVFSLYEDETEKALVLRICPGLGADRASKVSESLGMFFRAMKGTP